MEENFVNQQSINYKEPKKFPKLWIVLILLIIVIAASIFAFLIFTKKEKALDAQQSVENLTISKPSIEAILLFDSTYGTNMLVTDSQGRMTGYVNDVLFIDIPNSDVLGDAGEGQMMVIENPDSENNFYTIQISKTESGLASISISYTDSTTIDRETAEFNVESQNPVSLKVSITSGSNPLTISPVSMDNIPPNMVTDLRVTSTSENSIILEWTSPGDDGTSGTASSYDIRYSTSSITESNWNSATKWQEKQNPQPAGAIEIRTITGLSPGMKYYFALNAIDDKGNIALISNGAQATTLS
ncbi:MAG: fibronectin type III domain-containing protein [Candidatus Woesearchaeota archaeon]|nr:fibronectin type III domain-containing protein [Candidatus Woesearchaeota archaeon]